MIKNKLLISMLIGVTMSCNVYAADSWIEVGYIDPINDPIQTYTAEINAVNSNTKYNFTHIEALEQGGGGGVSQADFDALETDVNTNTTDIATNTTKINTNIMDIATNTTDIATNTTDIATNTTDITALQAQSSGFIKMSRITSSGTYSFDANTRLVTIYVTGGGGAGGGAPSGANKSAGAGGGAGGTRVQIAHVALGSSFSVTIGAGGIGVSGSNGNTGQDSIVTLTKDNNDTLTITGKGGLGGVAGVNSSKGAFLVATSAVGGTASGTSGTYGYQILGYLGSITAYASASDTLISGSGGETYLGGAGNSREANSTGEAFSGLSAVNYTGSGGGGALQTNNNTRTGGSGADGVVYVYEYA